MLSISRRLLGSLMALVMLGTAGSGLAQEDDSPMQIVVSLKEQRDPKLAPGLQRSRLSPELRALQKVEGGVLVGRTKRGYAVISTNKAMAARLVAESEQKQIDINTDPGESDSVDRLIVSYDGKPPTAESLKKAGLEIVEDYPKGTFLVVKPVQGTVITDRTARELDKNLQIKRVYPSHKLSLSPPDPDEERKRQQAPKPGAPRAGGTSASLWPNNNGVRSLANPVSPNDADFDRLWGIKAIHAPLAWTATTSSPVIVAVIDTGVDYEHPDLNANMWRSPTGAYGYNAITRQEDPRDDNGHGTHCAGTIAAVANNQLGVVGVTWNVQVMGVKFLDRSGDGNDYDAIRGIDYALDHGATVLSNSWGGGGFNLELDEAIHRAQSRGALFIAAAGNGGDDRVGDDNDGDEPEYPASYEKANVVAVMSVGIDGEKAPSSNYGRSSVHLAAPGREIFSTYPGRRYKTLSGTSMATPHVAGAVALTWGHPRYRAADWRTVRRAIEENVTRLPSLEGLCATGGVLNLSFLADTTTPQPGEPVEPPIVEPPSEGPLPIAQELVTRAAAKFAKPAAVVDAGNLLRVRLQLTEPCDVWIRANTSVTSNANIVDASIGFLNNERVDNRWTSSARHFSLTAGRWTTVTASHTVRLEAGTHDLYWKLWDEDNNGATLTVNAGTMTVEAIPIRTE